jgi:putative ABC transport system permease protein
MSWLHGIRHRIRVLLRPTAHERDLLDEMRMHLELDAMQQRDLYAARRRFGNRTYHQEEARRMTWLSHLDVLCQDVGYAWRSIRRTPGVTAMIVLTLALGLGVNTATFSFLDRMYLRAPDGVVKPENLRRWWHETSAYRSYNGQSFISPGTDYPTYAAIARASGDPRNFALYETDNMLFMRRADQKVRVRGVFATASYFNVLGVRPALGRLYTAAEDSMGQGSRVIVLSHRFWERALGGDSAVIGQTINLEYTDYAVIGVMQEEFEGLDMQAYDAWIPLAAVPPTHWMSQGGRWWEGDRANGFAMLQRSHTAERDLVFEQRATAEARAVNLRLRAQFADTLGNALTGPLVGAGPGRWGQDMIIANRLGAVAAIILVIACANVINLLLARAERRRRELAVRLALGVSRARLVRLLTTETVLLALLAAGGAVLAALWGGNLLRSLLFESVEWYESALHWRVVVFAIVIALVAGLIAGIIPAWQASNPNLTKSLKDGARDGSVHRSRLRSALVVTQAALSVMLLAGAALFVRSLNNVRGLDIGYDSDRLLFGSVSFEPDRRTPSAVVSKTIDELEARLRTRPGVEGVARSFLVPMQGISFESFFWGNDSSLSLRPHSPTFQAVSKEFFRTAGIRIVRGETFEDGPGAPKQLLVNEAMAQRVWPGRNAIGQCLRFISRESDCYTVTGVVENSRQSYVIEKDVVPMYYMPLGNLPGQQRYGTTIIVRASADATLPVKQELMSTLTRAFPNGTAKVTAMTETLEPEYRPWRLGATLFTAFGLLALVVAMIGIYSTVSYGVTQRRHEFGVRSALGAQLSDVLRQVVGEGLRIVAIGVVVGIALALAAGKLVSALLYGVKPSDPVVMTVVAVTLLAVAALATLIPAWRAARVDPVTALRTE